MGSYKEPVEGWIDNLYGPIAILYGAAYGILRITRINVKVHANIVPVDYCTNVLLACAWQTAQETGRLTNPTPTPPSTTPPIYNYVPSEQNMLTWGDFKSHALDLSDVFPLEHMVWFPFLHTTNVPWLFKLIAFFYHTLPGYLIDTVLRLRGQKPRMTKLYSKIHKNIKLLAPFVDTNWCFKTLNTQHLWKSLSQQDQQLFEFDMDLLNWQDYFYRSIGGMRIYLGKEDPSAESIERGQRKRAR